MTKEKVQKRTTRARMAKTGERYTTARHYALDLHHAPQDPFAPAPGNALPVEEILASLEPAPTESLVGAPAGLPARLAEPGMSEAAVQRATGKSWDEWFTLLDAWDGTTKTHPEIARHLSEACSIDGWWAQSVTVGYERARGMRAVHERPDGFSVNASKTLPVAAERLYAAIVDDDERAHWLHGIELRRRSAKAHTSARFDVLPEESRLNVYLTARGPGKATV